MISRIIKLITLILVLFSCQTRLKVDQSEELIKYRDKINKITNGKLGKSSTLVYFFDRSENSRVLGQCTNYNINIVFNDYIDIDKKEWYTMTEKEKILVLSHELIHCECDELHNDVPLPDNCNSSVMNSHAPDAECVSRHYELYLNEIKRGCEKE